MYGQESLKDIEQAHTNVVAGRDQTFGLAVATILCLCLLDGRIDVRLLVRSTYLHGILRVPLREDPSFFVPPAARKRDTWSL
jgi:hypothetical protein